MKNFKRRSIFSYEGAIIELWLLLENLFDAPLLNVLVMPLSIFLVLTSISLKNLIFEKASSGISFNKKPTKSVPTPKAKQSKC